MITGVPDHEALHETAVGWMILAWNNIIDCLRDVREYKEYLAEANDLKETALTKRISAVIRNQEYEINNALTLLQQSLEIFLKSMIAKVSPFLLIGGEPRQWPTPDKTGNVDFSDFRTVDAIDLCRVVNTVSDTKLSDSFVRLYNNLRVRRNKIAHLNTGSVVLEASNVLVSILSAQSLLFNGQLWQEFLKARTPHLADHDEDDEIYEEDVSHDIFLSNLEEAISNLQPAELKRFFGYDKRRKRIECPACQTLTSRRYDGDLRYAQKQADGSIFCFGCLTRFADQDTYDEFGQLV